MLRGRRQRFRGAGGSAEREFKRQLRQNIRDDWKPWVVGVSLILGAAVWSFFVGRVAGRIFAATSGFALGLLTVMYSLGGHVSAFRWWLGAEGERETAKEIERLGQDWHCEHDLEHGRGNYDHVLVGPAGVFLLDSKLLHGTSAAGQDTLRSGRIVFSGGTFRFGARQVKTALESCLGFRAPWVQSVVVIWGDFPQARHEERDVVYLRGEELVGWLSTLPRKATAAQCAAYVTALREVRHVLERDPAA